MRHDSLHHLNIAVRTAVTILIMACLALPVHADNDMASLNLFKSGLMQHGQWTMELLTSDDAATQKMMRKMGKMSMCTDIAKQMANSSNPTQANCTHEVLQNSANSAEVQMSCDNGVKRHIMMNRAGDNSYVVDATITSKDGKSRTMKARYTYEGECNGDSAIQLDKHSETCQKMRSQTQDKDLSALCTKAPEQYRAQCEQQLQQMQRSCQ